MTPRHRALLFGAMALVAAGVAAAGCSSSFVSQPGSAPSSAQAACGRSPGTAGIWRPEQNYCEY